MDAEGIDLIRWFFRVPSRRSKTWTSKDMAITISVPIGICNAAFRDAVTHGLVRFCGNGWEWVDDKKSK